MRGRARARLKGEAGPRRAQPIGMAGEIFGRGSRLEVEGRKVGGCDAGEGARAVSGRAGLTGERPRALRGAGELGCGARRGPRVGEGASWRADLLGRAG